MTRDRAIVYDANRLLLETVDIISTAIGRRYRRVTLVFVLPLITIWFGAFPGDAAANFADPAFRAQWQQGEAQRPNFWGPLSTARDGQHEPYAEAPDGQRLVQYFDKGRMELTNGTVTNGLLASEIVKGRVQVGNAAFQAKAPPSTPIAGDPDNPGPTYAQLGVIAEALLANTPSQVGGNTVAAVAADGTVTRDGAELAGRATLAVYDSATQHNVPGVFVDYRDKAGLQTIGFAISEPFFAAVKVAGQQKDVMIQLFERRVLTFTPTNDPAFQVEMGNIGQHYYQWRYGMASSSDSLLARQDTVPDGIDAQLWYQRGGGGEFTCLFNAGSAMSSSGESGGRCTSEIIDVLPLKLEFAGFAPRQDIRVEVTAPDGVVRTNLLNTSADKNAACGNHLEMACWYWLALPDESLGEYRVAAIQGTQRATGSFTVLKASEPRLMVNPGIGLPGTTFQILFAGFQPGEQIAVQLYRQSAQYGGLFYFSTTLFSVTVDRRGEAIRDLSSQQDDALGWYVLRVKNKDGIYSNTHFILGDKNT
jgi:hypothetical protein